MHKFTGPYIPRGGGGGGGGARGAIAKQESQVRLLVLSPPSSHGERT